jgi:GNAT superfamily N-acetyltransferase
MKNVTISIAATPEAIRRCHPVMRELRTHIHNAERFLERVQRQQKGGYLLAFLESEGEVRSAVGYRFLEKLLSGRYLYVDDLVTRESDRSQGYGEQLFAWLIEQAREHGCENLELDSGVQRHDAHRFYLVNGMRISAHHFKIKIEHQR